MGHVRACPRGNVGVRDDELRLEIETARRDSLPVVGKRLWAAVAAGEIGDQEAEQLDVLLRTRTAPSGAVGGPRTAAVPIHMLARPCGTWLYSLPSAAPRTH